MNIGTKLMTAHSTLSRRRSSPIVVSAACMFLLSACASGGSTNIPASGPGAQLPLTVVPAPPPPFGVPDAATGGNAPAGPEAVPGGSTLAGWQRQSSSPAPLPPNGTVFPLLQTAVKFGPDGNLAADSVTMQLGATVTVIDAAANQVRLQIPGLGIDITERIQSQISSLPDKSVIERQGVLLEYSTLGWWNIIGFSDGVWRRLTAGKYVLGYVTPQGAVPNSGTAVYAGKAAGSVYSLGSWPGDLYGDASVTVDFLSHAVTGKLTNMRAWHCPDFCGDGTPWNDVAISGTQSGSQIIGATSVSNAPNADSLSPAATGFFNGALFGPNANELGAIWTLSDGTKSAMGTFGAPRQ